MFFVSIGVDMGRVRLAKSQLQVATDAASLAGVQLLPSADHTLASNAAVYQASRNQADGTAVAVQPNNDIQYGLYRIDTHIYTPSGSLEPGISPAHTVQDSDCNAMKVTALRTSTRGNPVNLIFARIVGRSTFNVWASSTAFVQGGPTHFGIVGLDFIKANGNPAGIDSYSPALAIIPMSTVRTSPQPRMAVFLFKMEISTATLAPALAKPSTVIIIPV